MDLNDIQEKDELNLSEINNILILKKINSSHVGFKSLLSGMTQFFLQANLMTSLYNELSSMPNEIDTVVNTLVDKDYVETSNLELKVNADFKRTKTLTFERFYNILDKYKTKDELDIDLENTREQGKAVVNSMMNTLAMAAANAKATAKSGVAISDAIENFKPVEVSTGGGSTG